ncbi:MAG TPA: hypothetical protein VM513_29660 [Kofleriaceae bacterium]|nr:hypothetical protein [Kofleriaceae bacterium]
MHWFAVAAAAAFTKKLVARYRRGRDVQRILEDPPEIRTLARFELVPPASSRHLLEQLGEALTPQLVAWRATETAILACHPPHAPAIEAVRLVARDASCFTLELTRAWTGPRLGPTARQALARIHDVLAAHPAVRGLTWHGRQDRILADASPYPLAALP